MCARGHTNAPESTLLPCGVPGFCFRVSRKVSPIEHVTHDRDLPHADLLCRQPLRKRGLVNIYRVSERALGSLHTCEESLAAWLRSLPCVVQRPSPPEGSPRHRRGMPSPPVPRLSPRQAARGAKYELNIVACTLRTCLRSVQTVQHRQGKLRKTVPDVDNQQ